MEEAGTTIYGEAVETPLLRQITEQSVSPYIAEARLLSDDPQKLLEGVSTDQQFVANELRKLMLAAEKDIYILTPYFIPRKRGIELIRELRDKGIRIVILTNSLATNNHTAVHSAYMTYRKDLLRAGVELWEARADAAKIVNDDGTSKLEKLTLHTKGMLVDGRHLFVGSLNLDPRSIDINTEMGLLIDSPELGALLKSNAATNIPNMAYRLQLDENDKISWHATIDGREVVETKEPQTTGSRRFSAWLQKIAPEKQL